MVGEGGVLALEAEVEEEEELQEVVVGVSIQAMGSFSEAIV